MPTEHAELPLWANKSDSQKIETLKRMIEDLYAYELYAVRQKLLSILNRHTPFDQKESDDIRAITEMVNKHPNIVSKNCEIGHIVGSSLVIDLNTGRFLLHHHKSLKIFLQFGGHAEYEIDFSEVAMREAKEESGLSDLFFFPDLTDPSPLDIDMHTIPPGKNRPEHFHMDFRYLIATRSPNDLSPGPEESNNFLWLNWAEVLERKHQFYPPLIRLITKANQLYERHSQTIQRRD